MMQLIYRGYTYTVQATVQPQSYKPRALNWRYRVAGETYEPEYRATTYIKSRALNWRYQTNAMT